MKVSPAALFIGGVAAVAAVFLLSGPKYAMSYKGRNVSIGQAGGIWVANWTWQGLPYSTTGSDYASAEGNAQLAIDHGAG